MSLAQKLLKLSKFSMQIPPATASQMETQLL